MSEKQPETCIVEGCPNNQKARGLCESHYRAFKREMERIPEKLREGFDLAAVKARKILPKQPSVKPRRNPFAEFADQFLLEADEKTVRQIAEKAQKDLKKSKKR